MSTVFKLYEITGKPLDYGVFVKWMIENNIDKSDKEVFDKCIEIQNAYGICTSDSYQRTMDYAQNIRFLLNEGAPKDLVYHIILAEKLKKIRILRDEI
tara:strand:- start:774 stop:1067 length:294 start_codon:yes stop_codon:yes gene_type:complete